MVHIAGRGRDRLIAAVDIGSGYVGCALMMIRAKGPGIAIAHARSLLTLEERTPEQSIARVGEEVAQAVKAAYEMAGTQTQGQHVSAVYVILHAPWTSSKVVRAAENYPEAQMIRNEDIVALAQKSLAQGGIDRSRAFESTVLMMQLNGYPTSEPEGKKATRMEIASIVSACDMAMKGNIQTAIQTAFPAAKLYWRSEERIATDMLRRLHETGNLLVVSVGLLATHIMLMREGVPAYERLVDEGLRTMLARVHNVQPPSETLALFRLLETEACSTDACATLQKAVAEAEPALAQIFGEALAALAQEERLPNHLALIAHPDIAPWLSAFFARIDFTQFTETTLPFAIEVLDVNHLAPFVAADPTLDSALALAAAHAVVEEQST